MSLSFSVNFGYIPSYSSPPLATSVSSDKVSVLVYPLFYTKVVVEWLIPPSLGNCTFNVYKGDTDTGPWIKINPTPLVGTNFFQDSGTQAYSKFRESYYIVEVRLPSPDSRYFTSNPATWLNNRSSLMELRAAEITRRETLLLNNFIGVDTLVYRRKYFGERCPNCYDPISEKIVKDHCITCYGTSFAGGYFPGIQTKIHFEASPNSTELNYQGKKETNITSAWTISNPSISPLDLLVRMRDFKVFRVGDMNATEIQTVQVRQVMQVIELSKSSVEMNLLSSTLPGKYTTPVISGITTSSSAGVIYKI